MQNITIETGLIIISIIFYGIVFFIQKAQIQKQNDLFNKYEKIFSIINIDEIEKYVEIQRKSIHLSLSNRETELLNNEILMEKNMKEIQTILNTSKTNFEKSNEISEYVQDILNRSQTMLDNTRQFMKKFSELNIKEFQELHSIVKSNIEEDNPEIFNKIDNELIRIVEKYDSEKRVIMDKYLN